MRSRRLDCDAPQSAGGAVWGTGDLAHLGPALIGATVVGAAALVLALTVLPEVLAESTKVLARDE